MGDTRRHTPHDTPSRSDSGQHQHSSHRPSSDRPPSPRAARATIPQDMTPFGPVVRGTIKRLQKDRGFGFIRTEQGLEYFFHRSVCAGVFDALFDGHVVEFQPMNSSKGPRATDVKKI